MNVAGVSLSMFFIGLLSGLRTSFFQSLFSQSMHGAQLTFRSFQPVSFLHLSSICSKRAFLSHHLAAHLSSLVRLARSHLSVGILKRSRKVTEEIWMLCLHSAVFSHVVSIRMADESSNPTWWFLFRSFVSSDILRYSQENLSTPMCTQTSSSQSTVASRSCLFSLLVGVVISLR